MKFKEVKNPFLKNCKNFVLGNNQLIGFSGKQAVLLNYNFELLGACDNLSYVYHGELSPQYNKLLLISNENRFYVYEFPSLERVSKITLHSPYNYNLEGNGCWSFDGKKILICATNSKTLNSSLRIFDNENLYFFEDLLKEKYWLMNIQKIEHKGLYYLLGFNRKDYQTYLILYDEKKIQEFCIEKFNGIVINTKYNKLYDCIEIYSENSVFFYDCEGKMKDKKDLISPEVLINSFSNIFENSNLNENQLSKIRKLSNSFDFENMKIKDSISDICISNDCLVAFVATFGALKAYNIKSQTIIDELKMEYGVQKIDLFSENRIVVSTWNGVRIFELL